MMVLLLSLACKPAPSPEMLEAAAGRGAQQGPVRERVAGPFRWTGPSNLCLEVPVGWEGTTGPPPQLLELALDDAGTVRIAVWPWGTPVPQVPDGSSLVFLDEDSYRAVPVLQPAATYTLSTADGGLTQGWYGSQDGRVVVVEVSAEPGHTTRARDAATPLLQGLTRCGVSAAGDAAGP